MVVRAAAKYADAPTSMAPARSSTPTTPNARKISEKVAAPSRDRSRGRFGRRGGGAAGRGAPGYGPAYGPCGANGGR
ncbi:hypothetical protein GCM10012279_45760 [Micromonospora yangpuensis]|nr:hypothetical protein GCM10012279_45760 [Micromonospora yangpuensis]